MRLKKLKVAGFKSFVDPTPITVPADLVGIVGPNGCGKSNVIDAVRWVMGESSAKTLRGDQMADVIFNGSSSRKPVGKASVELLFHNDGGKIPESYANFSEIGIKRTLTREGKSEYFVNNTRARRRDIQDIFRGTGLGPRSYSIIEQGMVSRIVESKPEDLRSFVEEAAGISKYKDRRRETENRIRHTRENLERVVDIIRELELQLRRLQRQSQAARRYNTLKTEENIVQGQLYLMRHGTLQTLGDEQTRRLAELENILQKTIAEQREIEHRIENLRVESTERREDFGQIQARYYQAGAEISALEQKIAHEQDTRRQREEDLDKLKLSLGQLEQERSLDRENSTRLQARLTNLQQQREQAGQALAQSAAVLESAEQDFALFQEQWEQFNTSALAPQRQLEVQKSVIVEQRNQYAALEQRQTRLESECEALLLQISQAEPASLRTEVSQHQKVVEQTAATLAVTEEQIVDTRQTLELLLEENSQLGRERHSDAARLHSLKEIQAAALGEDDEEFQSWISSHGLDKAEQLVSTISVVDGWERAADALLGPFLTAIVSPSSIPGLSLENTTATDLSLIEASGPGASKKDSTHLAFYMESSGADLDRLIGDVLVAENVESAFEHRLTLKDGQIVVTRDGVLMGPNWIRLPGSQSKNLGMLAREEEIRSLSVRVVDLDGKILLKQQEIETNRAKLRDQETLRNQNSQTLTRVNREHADMQNRLGQREARFSQLNSRLDHLKKDREELEVQIGKCESRIESADQLRTDAEQAVALFEQEKQEWIQRKRNRTEDLEHRRAHHQQCRDAKYGVDTEWQLESSSLKSLEETLRRLEIRRDEMVSQSSELNDVLRDSGTSEQPLQESLGVLLQGRETIENELNISRQESERVDLGIQENQQQLNRVERDVDLHREQLGQQKLTNQETALRMQNLLEQIEAGKYDLEKLVEDLPESANELEWREKLELIGNKIGRIGPVNLVAIEEFEEQSERKLYLDKQNEDLTSALETLEAVIRKIDRETRVRFKETFDKLNEGFQVFFPQLFGGGTAVLELTDNDYLTTGVTVMARPPGKRNSTIHLLSGGEKALTAVSLLFSLFQLNPAPFCLLDEVDAPLDDANVERYCKTLKTLSRQTQLLVITHNKITMEAADILVGVTMSEPGVSRLVSVDIAEAVEMAAS